MENTIHGISDARSLIRPRFFFLGLFVIALMSIVGCKNENENLDKLLFLMDMNNSVQNYPYVNFGGRVHHYNVDSILTVIDTTEFTDDFVKPGRKKAKIVFPPSWLDSIATNEQLLQIIRDKKHAPATRVCAFAALIERKYEKLEQLVLENYKDTAKLTVYFYDYGVDEHVGSCFLRYADVAKERALLSVQDSLKNDSLALFTTDIPFYSFLDWKIERMQPKDEVLYRRIRELYKDYPSESLLRVLAGYHKIEDQEFIAGELGATQEAGSHISRIMSALSAVKVWPCQRFKSGLTALRDRIITGEIDNCQINGPFIHAIMAYDYSWAHNFLDVLMAKESKLPKRKNRFTLVDEFHEVMFSDSIPQYGDLLKKYPSKFYTKK